MVVLSDDEASTELQSVNIKMEPGTNKNAANALEIGLIDLTEDIFEDADIPRHYISWLSDLLEKAKIKPSVVEQPSEEVAVATTATATTSSDVVLVEEPTESGQVSSGIICINNILNDNRHVLLILCIFSRSLQRKLMWQALARMSQAITSTCPALPITPDLCLRAHVKM